MEERKISEYGGAYSTFSSLSFSYGASDEPNGREGRIAIQRQITSELRSQPDIEEVAPDTLDPA